MSSAAKIGVFPGQFDPVTLGHLDVIRRAVPLFDLLYIAVGINPEKRELFSQSERVEMIRELIRDDARIRVESYAGLTVDFVRRVGGTVMLRGIRDTSDLRYEFQLAQANKAVGGIETVFIMTGDQYALTSSALIRQVLNLGGDVRALATMLPQSVIVRLQAMRGQVR